MELVAAINDDWLEGRLNGKQGLFPTAFVKFKHEDQHPTPDSDSQSTSSQSSANEVIVLYTFNAEMNTDLSLVEGDRVQVTAMVEGGQWLLGQCGGRSGQFPANFVDRIPENLPLVTL